MTGLIEFIQALCPDGVVREPLGELVRIRNGRDHKSLGEGEIPAYGTGGVIRMVDTAAHPGPSVLIPRKGSLGKLYYVDRPFWTVDTIFYTEVGTRLEPKFLFYYLGMLRLERLNVAGGVPSLTQTELNRLLIPVPSIEVQREVVRVLDSLSSFHEELESQLKAELEARRKQYAFYRDRLLSFPEFESGGGGAGFQ